jgi:hypothetical protein
MQAKCFCPKHGKLDFEDIVIRNGAPTCGKCSSELQFGTVKPRFDVNRAVKPKGRRKK